MTNYVLITPARDEAAYLPMVIEAVSKQTVRPTKWIIVSDGSIDGTDEIVIAASMAAPFIQLVSRQAIDGRSFGSKALAFREGLGYVQNTQFNFIGNLDADVTFDAEYYERLIERMSENPALGVASGVCWDKTDSGFRRTTSSLNHAVGAVQFWRRECFDDVGGYRPVSVGGIDSLAELIARMKGWDTRSFPELPVYHHKPVDMTNGRTGFRIAYRAGLTEYHIGTCPLFAVIKAVRRWKERPVVLSVFVRLFAFGRLLMVGAKRDAPQELVAYLKKEHISLLKQVILRPQKILEFH